MRLEEYGVLLVFDKVEEVWAELVKRGLDRALYKVGGWKVENAIRRV